MYRKLLLTAALATAFVAPAFAAAPFYVEQNTKTKKCAVTEKKPNGTSEIQVGTTDYKTKADAEKAMKAASECKA